MQLSWFNYAKRTENPTLLLTTTGGGIIFFIYSILSLILKKKKIHIGLFVIGLMVLKLILN